MSNKNEIQKKEITSFVGGFVIFAIAPLDTSVGLIIILNYYNLHNI